MPRATVDRRGPRECCRIHRADFATGQERGATDYTAQVSAKSKRAIALDQPTVDLLREHGGEQVLWKLELGKVYDDQGLVFPRPFGKPLDPATLTSNFEKLAKNAGIEHVRLHDLRHFHATTLLRAGTHLKVVQERLGHASISNTADTYSHVAPDPQKQAATAFAGSMDSHTG